jgi:DNA polymerase-1
MIMVRGGIIPSKGNVLLAADYGGHEVGIIACYSKDKVLVKEREQGADIHQEWADFLQLSGFDSKMLRFDAKNAFVFALFYGSYFRNIHADLVSRGYHDLPIMRVQKAEQEFWKKYRGVKKFQEELINLYKRNGYVEMMHGFRRRGFLTKNEIVNTVVQGTAFHVLLESCNILNDIRKEENWESKWIGEIHDEILGDIFPPELKYIAETTKRVMTKDVLKNNPWICIPLISELSVTEINGAWHTKKDYIEK